MTAKAVLTLAIGFVSGVLSGVFGIGGGIVTTPALRLLLHAPALVAVGTPLPVIIPGAFTGAWSYARRGEAEVRMGLTVASVGAPVSVLGALATRLVGGTVVLLGTAALIAYVAVDMIVGAVQAHGSEPAPVSASARPSWPRMALVGVLAGAYSGFFGLGGGFVLVPGLNRLLGLDLKRSIATSLVAVAVLAVPGTIAHAALGNIDWRYALGLIVGVVPGALVGARLTAGARERELRIGFAVLLVVTGIILAASEMGVV